MSAYILKDHGYPTFKKIMHGGKWVGRVCKVPGGYLGIIGKTEYEDPDEGVAFDEVVSRHLGYENSAALRSHNSTVRGRNSAIAARRRALVQQFSNSSHDERLKMLFSMIDNL